MSIQTTIGSTLVGIGIGAGDIATLVTVGYRIGNWLTAPKSDTDLLALLEEPESAIVRRRGIMDITRFNRRWDVRMRLLENGRAQRLEGKAVERLLKSHSQWTGLMICIVAALDEFADASTVRLVIKALLQKLFSTGANSELNEDLINFSLSERINGWRSAATIREMNTACRGLRQDLIQRGFAMQGHIPREEASEIIGFLYWLLTQDTEDCHTSSSDLAGIACCLCHLSFEILSVEGFDGLYSRETSCRLIYSDGPGLGSLNADPSLSEAVRGRRWSPERESSTIVSLTQPEETFSTFPISRAIASKCREAWSLGIQAAKPIEVSPTSFPTHSLYRGAADMRYLFTNEGTSVALREGPATSILSLAQILFIFPTIEVIQGLEQALTDASDIQIKSIYLHLTAEPRQYRNGWFQRPEVFHVMQAFVMGYWYTVLGSMVDTSDLAIKTVSGYWGHSTKLCQKLQDFVIQVNDERERRSSFGRDVAEISPQKVLHLVGLLYANVDAKIADYPSAYSLRHQSICVGIVGKRTVLCTSLLRNSHTPHDAAKYVILDCDIGGIPRNKDGLVMTGVSSVLQLAQEINTGSHCFQELLCLRGSEQDCTRHIQVDWDADSGAVLLCIRYKGRRIATVNPAFADRAFLATWQTFPSEPGFTFPLFTRAYEVTLEAFVEAGGLPMPPPTNHADCSTSVIVVQSQGNECFRYAATAWYSEHCEVVLVNGDVQEALDECRRSHGKGLVALIA